MTTKIATNDPGDHLRCDRPRRLFESQLGISFPRMLYLVDFPTDLYCVKNHGSLWTRANRLATTDIIEDIIDCKSFVSTDSLYLCKLIECCKMYDSCSVYRILAVCL